MIELTFKIFLNIEKGKNYTEIYFILQKISKIKISRIQKDSPN
jgi:hypothetical protein